MTLTLTAVPELADQLVGKPPTTPFSGVQCDSRRVRPGDLFVALSGARDEGSKYAAAALAKGAVLVLSEKPIRECAKTHVLVKDARTCFALLSAAINGYPTRTLKVYGITGTNGKTTTAWLLSEFLKASGQATGLLTTVQVAYGPRVIPATRTTPDAGELNAHFAAMREVACNAAVMEVSSHAIDQQRVAGVRFAAVAFTNLSQDHLDYHHTMEAYRDAKRKLFAQVARDTPGTPAICCVETASGRDMADYIRTLPLRCITCGFEAPADFRAEGIAITPHGSTFTLVVPTGERLPLTLQLAGRYNIANALCAIALAYQAGVPLSVIGATLPTLKPQWGRIERVDLPPRWNLFVDYAHTDDALTNVLTTLRELKPARLLVVFGCGGDRDRAKRPLMGHACAQHADLLIVTSDNPRSEAPEAIIQEILPGIPQGTALHIEPDRRAAIRWALASAQPGDIILVAGKGHETFQEIAGRSFPFDDRRVAQEEAASLAAL